jgi:AcrR family transcriptional regulator
MANMRETIIAVSIDLFHRKGYFATSVSDIAKGSGIQKASIYYHFSSKEDLLYHIMRATMVDLNGYLTRNLSGIEDIEARMRVAVRSHVRFHLERQKENFIANSELRGLTAEHFRDIVTLRDAYEQVFQQLIREGASQGTFVHGDAKLLSYAILTLCTAGAAWYKPEGRLTAEQISHIYERFVIAGLKTADAGLFQGAP